MWLPQINKDIFTSEKSQLITILSAAGIYLNTWRSLIANPNVQLICLQEEGYLHTINIVLEMYMMSLGLFTIAWTPKWDTRQQGLQ